MPTRYFPTLCQRARLSPLALAIPLAFAGAMSAALPQHARAHAAAGLSFDIPAGPLADALNRFALQAGVSIVVDAARIQGLRAPALQGRMGVEEGFGRLLHGSGYQIARSGAGYLLVAAPAAGGAAPAAPQAGATLQTVTVTGIGPACSGECPASYRAENTTSASRLPVPSRDIAQTVDVVTQASLRDRGAGTLQQALAYTPGIEPNPGEGTRDQFVIRGFSAIADTYVDGMRDSAQLFRDTFNLEQVEVVKGPIGVLYGRGSSGGMINLVTKKPLPFASREVAATYGSFNSQRVSADINQPISDDWQIRFNAFADNAGSFRDAVFSRQRGLALASAWTLSPRLSAHLDLTHATDDRVFDGGIPGLNGAPAPVPRGTYYGALNPDPSDRGNSESSAAQFMVRWAVMPSVELQNTLRLGKFSLDRRQTAIDRLILTTPTPTLRMNRSNFANDEKNAINKTELTKSLDAGGMNHLLLLGLELSRSERDSVSRGGTLTAANDLPVFNPVLKPVPAEGGRIRRDGIYTTHTTSFYAQDLITFSRQWKGLLGIRSDRLQRDFSNRAGLDFGRNDNFTSPRLGLVYQPTQSQSYFLSASRSYQPGGNTGQVDPGNVIYPAEITTNLEIGGKLTVLAGLDLSVSAFRTVKDNVPTRDPGNPNGPDLLIGEVTSRGLELALAGDIGQGWSVQGGATLTDAFVSRSNNTVAPAITPTPPATPAVGKKAANTPRTSASLWAMKRIDAHWRAGVGVIHKARTYASTTNAVVLPAFTTLDASLHYDAKPWLLSLLVRNVTNTMYYQSASNDLGILPGAPRSVALSARYSF